MKSLTTFTAAVLGLGASVAAQTKNCPAQGICYSLGVPPSTSSSGNGDIFFQLSAPSSLRWVALGEGNQMAGAQMFIMYASADGKNVTVSPRLGVGQVMPLHNPDAQISLLEGSGIKDGMMVANVRCSSCSSWSGGKMDLTASGSSNWIYSYKAGSPLNTNDESAVLTQHDYYGNMNFKLSAAAIGHDLNPFVAATGTGSPASNPTQSSSPSSGSDPIYGSPSEYSGPGGFIGLSASKQNMIILAHGILASVAFVALFPIGGILIRLGGFSGLVWLHGALQTIAFIVYIAAFGLGIYMATSLKYMKNKHPIIGIILLAFLFFQPFLGLIHHKKFKQTSGRTAWSYIHVTIGRVAIILGMINGGFGLQLVHATQSARIAYGVCAGISGTVYIASAIFGESKRAKAKKQAKGSLNMSEVGSA